jgi:beta-glucosidase
VVVVLISGRPLATDEEIDAATSFVAAWLPGSEGDGVADVLFGDRDVHGRLPSPWPGSSGEDPRFPYGFGLTYGS